MENKHTKLPFRVVDDKWKGVSITGGEQVTFTVCTLNRHHPLKITNAEFIVRACNAHYGLLEACEKMVTAWHENNLVELRQMSKAILLAKQAIAKATGNQAEPEPMTEADQIEECLDGRR